MVHDLNCFRACPVYLQHAPFWPNRDVDLETVLVTVGCSVKRRFVTVLDKQTEVTICWRSH
jgi:hypothetical protein